MVCWSRAEHCVPERSRGPAWRGLRRSVVERDGSSCYLCGAECVVGVRLSDPRLLTVDHVLPVARGGRSVAGNLRVCCWGCNQLKGRGGGNGV